VVERERGDTRPPAGVILVVDEDRVTRDLVVAVLERSGYELLTASTTARGHELALECSPDLIISDVTAANPDGVGFLSGLREDANTNAVPFILLTEFGASGDVVHGFDASADSTILKPVRPPELVGRVRAAFAKSSQPASVRSPQTGHSVLNEPAFLAECKSDIENARLKRLPAALAYLELFELAGIRETLGARGEAIIVKELAALMRPFTRIVRLGADANGRFMLFIAAGGSATRELLNDVSRVIVEHRFHVGAEPIRLTPIVGFATRTGAPTFSEMRRRATFALGFASSHLDLQAVCYDARLELQSSVLARPRALERARGLLKPLEVPVGIAATFAVALGLPFAAYAFAAEHGLDITYPVYVAFVIALLLTSLGIWAENVLALTASDPPPAGVYPPASAIIAAYLPNEAATIIETIESFLALRYEADVQIILAYNTPRSLPMEEELHAIAARDPRFVPLRVFESNSKAQNVNAALRIVRSAFVGVFDADHKPDPGSFTRAWDWLASGYDIVQGHCTIRNGDESPVARLVAIEFESIYAVSHPGRTKMHGFGLFGGSNGYWKTDLLRQTRMHHFMLTEDIDSSLRVVEAGYRIASDPKLISRELAPLTLRAIWHQRLRWAQGWFQVSLKHLVPALRSPYLNVRQKLGIVHLLLWRECYVWLCLQLLPLLAFWTFARHESFSFFVPIFAITTVVTLATGPLQLLFTYFLAVPEIRRRRSWFWGYLAASFLFFGEFKNVVSRFAHFNEAIRERTWKVTPRSTAAPPTLAETQ
jgi:cellulose synthase/poly-beta-1,6-N-acetylglucosamine synthase-like glycosyltransferase/CheY-like chemotaxis protein